MDNFAWVSWFLYGGGSQLYDQLWKEMKVNVKGFILQPVGPEALGWFKKPINIDGGLSQAALPHAARHPGSDL